MNRSETERDIERTKDQQDTGTHKKPGSKEQAGADRFGGTRAGQENVESANDQKESK
jgi:hypothetical protein